MIGNVPSSHRLAQYLVLLTDLIMEEGKKGRNCRGKGFYVQCKRLNFKIHIYLIVKTFVVPIIK